MGVEGLFLLKNAKRYGDRSIICRSNASRASAGVENDGATDRGGYRGTILEKRLESKCGNPKKMHWTRMREKRCRREVLRGECWEGVNMEMPERT